MNSRRLAIVTSRFWPIFGMPQMVAADLAIGFKQQGHDVEIVTTRWEQHWSRSLSFRGVPVTRLTATSGGPWGNFRAQRALSKKLTEVDYEGVVLFGLEDSLETVVTALSKKATRIVLRLDDSVGYQALWTKSLTRKMLTALNSVDAIVCTSNVLRERLLAIGVENDNLIVIPDGAALRGDQPRTPNEQSLARMALSEAHPVFAIQRDQPLMVTGVPLNGDAGIFDLVRAWKKVATKMPQARLWIMGDGPQCKLLWNKINEANLVYSAILPGFIDCLDDLFDAADLYIHPSRNEGGQAFLTRAIASGVCAITTDDLGGTIRDGVTGTVIPKQDPEAMATSIITLIRNAELRNELGFAGKMSLPSELAFDSTIASYLSLTSDRPFTTSQSNCESVG